MENQQEYNTGQVPITNLRCRKCKTWLIMIDDDLPTVDILCRKCESNQKETERRGKK